MQDEFDKLKQTFDTLGALPPTAKEEYSAPSDASQGLMTINPDPVLDTAGAPTAPPISVAQRGKPLPGTAPLTQQQPSFTTLGALPSQQGQEGLPPAQPLDVLGAGSAAASNIKLVFTGVTGAGKSFIAQQLGLTELQIQDDITELYRNYFPGQTPPLDFVNTLVVWGEGIVDPKTPVTPARLIFIDFMRSMYSDFGTRGFWQSRLLLRANQATNGVAVTTCTSQDLLNELKAAGFSHFHIACSNNSLAARKRRPGANDALAAGFTNLILKEVSMRPQGSALPLVWDDNVPAPSPRFLTLETLRRSLQSEQQNIVTGE